MLNKEELEFIVNNPTLEFIIEGYRDNANSTIETITNVYLKISMPKQDPSFPPQPFYICAFNSIGDKLETFVNASSLGRKGNSGFMMLLSAKPVQERN